MPSEESGSFFSRRRLSGSTAVEKSPQETLGSDTSKTQSLRWGRRCLITAVAAAMTCTVSFASSIFSAAVTPTSVEFSVSEQVVVLGVSLYVLGFAIGPLFWAPLSERNGRRAPLLIGFSVFMCCQAILGLAGNLTLVLISRLAAGLFGSATLAVVPGLLVDLWNAEERSFATLAYACAVFSGPMLGPVAGTFIVTDERLGWRWTAWITLLISAPIFLLEILIIPETLRQQGLCERPPSVLQDQGAEQTWPDVQPHRRSPSFDYGIKPLRMICSEPVLGGVTAFVSLAYGILYLSLYAIPFSFVHERAWSLRSSSLPFLCVLGGSLLAFAILVLGLRLKKRKQKTSQALPEPEDRLPPMIAGAVLLTSGLVWFAFTSLKAIPWIAHSLACVCIGCGIILVFVPGIAYLVEIYPSDINSALAANSFVRSLAAAGFPHISSKMYQDLGTKWATGVLALSCALLIPVPVIFYLYGKKIRCGSNNGPRRDNDLVTVTPSNSQDSPVRNTAPSPSFGEPDQLDGTCRRGNTLT